VTSADEIHFFKKKPSFEEIYPLIDTDIIEIVPFVYEGVRREGYVDEEGLIKDKEVNIRAMEMDFFKGHRMGLPLVGDVAIWVPDE